MPEQIAISSLKMAIKIRQPCPGLIHHSDRGGQYAGKEYRKIIKWTAMKQSMSRAGECYDNAFMESCFGTIKTELEMTEYKNYNEAQKEIRSYISYYYTTAKENTLKLAIKRQANSTKAELKLRDPVAT